MREQNCCRKGNPTNSAGSQQQKLSITCTQINQPITSTIAFRHSTLAYHRWGQGSRLAICLHGYGESGAHYAFLSKEPALAHYSIFAIDLPWHGHTVWNEGLEFSGTELREILTQIIQKEGLTHAAQQGIDLIGFSLGGRLALSMLTQLTIPVRKLILLAPDGLKLNFWYWFATQTWLGRQLFRFTMLHPGWFFGFLKIFNKLGLVNSSIFKFVRYYIGNKEVRAQLYQRWIGLRRFRPNLKAIKSHLQKSGTQVRLLYGQHDRIILPIHGQKFVKGIEAQARCQIVESGHQLLHEKHSADIVQALLT